MLKFTVLENLKPNNEILNIIKGKTIKITNGVDKIIHKTNIRIVEPIIYEISSNGKNIMFYEYKLDEKSNKNFYIPNLKQTFTLSEMMKILKNY